MYKTILVHVDHSAASAARVAVAARLAQRAEAHLIGAAMTGLSAFMFPVSAMSVGMPPVVFPIDELRDEADAALAKFDSAVRQAGVDAFESRRIDEDAAVGMCLQARYCDLVVIGQNGPDALPSRLRPDFAQYVLLHSGRPVLVVPSGGFDGEIGNSVTVAWNGSADAARAIASALPLLKRAGRVDLAVFDAEHIDEGDEPGADMALYLARHGVKVVVSAHGADDNVGKALLAFAADKKSDLIVMGAFGHSRLREVVLGGVTQSALSRSPIPLWMAH